MSIVRMGNYYASHFLFNSKDFLKRWGLLRKVYSRPATSAPENKNETFSRLNSELQEKIKELNKMEREIQAANEKMTRIVAEKNNFLAMASHDLKSPLNSMLGLLNVLKADSANMTGDQHENVGLIFNAGKNMKAMIDKLLDLNRIEQGKSLVQKTPLDLVPIVRKAVDGMSMLAIKKDICITVVDAPDHLSIVSDATIIPQILDNLISNAVKFSPAQKNVKIRLFSQNEKIIIEVEDEGPGIKPEEAHRLFGKFQKLSARPTGGETSTGLGLSIVKELVATLDGKITFTSKPSVCTIFTVELPDR